jgi:ER lumen protein retaining receptor
MDLFRFIADMLHVAAIIILLSKMLRQKSSAGISLRTQFLYVVVFVTRYLDLFYYFISVYNTVMKLFFIASAVYICYLMHFVNPWKATHDKDNDTFRLRYLIVPCAILALLFHRESLHEVRTILWTFSEYLEAVAVLPQIFLLEHTDRYDALTSHYLAALGAYRLFYIFSWIYRYVVDGELIWVSLLAGVIQTLLYCDFLYQYFQQVVRKVKSKYDLAQ